MFIIIEYLSDLLENINILTDEDGFIVLFHSRTNAENYAEKECAWDYKIVELD